MSLHYSDEKALASSEAKREVLTYFFHLIQGHRIAGAVLQGDSTFLPKGAFTWEDVAQLHHTQVAARYGTPPHPSVFAPPVLALTAPSPPCERERPRRVKKEKKDKKRDGEQRKESKKSKRAKKETRPDGHA